MAENMEPEKRSKAGQFVKGVSGNPGGRPKTIQEIRDLARSYTAEAMEALLRIATSGKNESARVSAANSILERGWGKAPATLDNDGEGYVIQVLKLSNANNPNPQ